MSILYQALKRREQLDTKTDSTLRPSFSSYASPKSGVGNVLRFVLALAIIGAGGYIAYTTYYTPMESVETPVDTTMAVPIVTPVVTPQTAVVAPVVTNEETDIVTTPDFNPNELKSIADVAAMLPGSAAQPLPIPPVKVESNDSPTAMNKRAMELQSRGARDAAIQLYDEADAAGGADFSSRVNKWGLIAQTDAAKAVPALRRLVAERPRDAAARAQLGIALVKTGKYREARIELEKASALTPATSPDSAQVWYNLGVLYDKGSDRTAAIMAYEKALSGAVNNGQQKLIDTSAIQRRLSYLRATPPAAEVPAAAPVEPVVETKSLEPMPAPPLPFTRKGAQ